MFRSGLYTTFLAVGTVFGYFFSIPLLLRMVHGLPTVQIGLVIFPGALSAACLGFVGGRMADRCVMYIRFERAEELEDAHELLEAAL